MPILGLDLGDNNFRAVQLEKKKDTYLLTKFGEYENPRLDLNSEKDSDIEGYADALRDFFIETGFDVPDVAASLNEMFVYMTNIKLPQMNEADLKNSITYEASQHIPLSINEVYLSSQKLDNDMVETDKMNVQLVAAKKVVVDKYVHILKKAKLVPRAIEPETLALTRALGDTKENPVGTMIVDTGLSRTLIVISYGGAVRFTRSVPIGGEVITRAVQQGLNLDYAQAEEYKKVYGMDHNQVDGKIFAVVKPVVDNIISEIKRANIFFTKTYPNVTMKRIIIAGGTAQMPGLLLYLANNIDVEVELANPLRAVEISPKLGANAGQFADKASLYSVAIGLAMRE